MERFLTRSKLINGYYEKDFDISFSWLFLAFQANDDPISQWFRGYARAYRINVTRILAERNVDQQIMDDIASCAIRTSSLRASYRLTTSAMRYMTAASEYRESLLNEKKNYPLSVHHLMGVFIYKPWVHERDLVRWGFDRADWSKTFLKQMQSLCPEELEFWKMEHIKTFNIENKV